MITKVENHNTANVISTWDSSLNRVTVENWKNSVAHCEKLMAEEYEKERLSLVSPQKLIIDLMDSDVSDSDESDSESDILRAEEKKEQLEEAERKRKDALLEKVYKSFLPTFQNIKFKIYQLYSASKNWKRKSSPRNHQTKRKEKKCNAFV